MSGYEPVEPSRCVKCGDYPMIEFGGVSWVAVCHRESCCGQGDYAATPDGALVSWEVENK